MAFSITNPPASRNQVAIGFSGFAGSLDLHTDDQPGISQIHPVSDTRPMSTHSKEILSGSQEMFSGFDFLDRQHIRDDHIHRVGDFEIAG